MVVNTLKGRNEGRSVRGVPESSNVDLREGAFFFGGRCWQEIG